MAQVDRLSRRHLERNFFLMTGFLMTGLFDFVAYGVGLITSAQAAVCPGAGDQHRGV
jgi:hypothetical protein